MSSWRGQGHFTFTLTAAKYWFSDCENMRTCVSTAATVCGHGTDTAEFGNTEYTGQARTLSRLVQ
jgi:hypothetical protein